MVEPESELAEPVLFLWATPNSFWGGWVDEVRWWSPSSTLARNLQTFCLSQVLGLQVSIIIPDYLVKNAGIDCFITLVEP